MLFFSICFSFKPKGIVIKEENGDDYSGGPKKTKILVPLKDLMNSLQHKTFLVAPLGPGKKVIRLTGTETVKGAKLLLSHSLPDKKKDEKPSFVFSTYRFCSLDDLVTLSTCIVCRHVVYVLRTSLFFIINIYSVSGNG